MWAVAVIHRLANLISLWKRTYVWLIPCIRKSERSGGFCSDLRPGEAQTRRGEPRCEESVRHCDNVFEN
jgi:hypothetical protein